MKIKQSVINTFERVGIDYKTLQDKTEKVVVSNRFGGGSCETSPLIARCIAWIYATNNDYERGIQTVKIADFDRVRYFILDTDSNAYSTCYGDGLDEWFKMIMNGAYSTCVD